MTGVQTCALPISNDLGEKERKMEECVGTIPHRHDSAEGERTQLLPLQGSGVRVETAGGSSPAASPGE